MKLTYSQLLELANEKAVEAEAHAESDEFDQETFDTLMQEAEGYRNRAGGVKKAQALVNETKAADPKPTPSGIVVTGDEADRANTGNPFKSLGEVYQMIAKAAADPGATDIRLKPALGVEEAGFYDLNRVTVRSSKPETKGKAITGMSELVPADGGFLVGTDERGFIGKPDVSSGNIVPLCQNVPISGTANSVVMQGINETSRATGSRWGGIRGYRLAEGDQLTASNPTFRRIRLETIKYGTLVYATSELLADAMRLETLLNEASTDEIQFMIQDDLINGAVNPLGVLNGGCLVSVAAETGQPAATIVAENISKMWARRWVRGNYVWLINQDVEPELDNLNIASGTAGQLVYMPAGGLSARPYATLKGAPVMTIEHCATKGTLGDILLVDMSTFLLATKGGVQQAMSVHLRFDYDESVFRTLARAGGQPLWSKDLTPYKGTDTIAPFIGLATRS